MNWPAIILGAFVGVLFVAILSADFGGKPVVAPLPADANACLKAGMKLVIDFKSNKVTCEDR